MIPDEFTIGPAPYVPPAPPYYPPAPVPIPAPRPAGQPRAWSPVAWLALVLALLAGAPHVVPLVVPHPVPAPTPAPDPVPPVPAAYTGPLFGVFVVPDPEDAPAAALAVDPAVRNAMDARSAVWRAYKADTNEAKAYAKYLAPPNDPPCVLWLRGDASLINATKPATRDAVLKDLIAIRGK